MDFSSPDLFAIFWMKEGTAIKKQNNPEQWLLDQLEALTRRQASAEETPRCCADSFLHAYAARPRSFSLSDLDVVHVSSCNYCLPRLLQIRAARAKSHFLIFRIASTASVGVACLLIGFWTARLLNRPTPPVIHNQSTNLHRTMELTERMLDLTEYGTYRSAGSEPALPTLILPASSLHLNLILPRFSESGTYYIMVAADRDGQDRLACAGGEAASNAGQTKVEVILDLRNAKPGNYFLLTLLKGRSDPYSYPLRIQ